MTARPVSVCLSGDASVPRKTARYSSNYIRHDVPWCISIQIVFESRSKIMRCGHFVFLRISSYSSLLISGPKLYTRNSVFTRYPTILLLWAVAVAYTRLSQYMSDSYDAVIAMQLAIGSHDRWRPVWCSDQRWSLFSIHKSSSMGQGYAPFVLVETDHRGPL